MGEGAWSGPLLGLRVSVRLLSLGTRDCVEPAQRKVGQRTDRSRRRRVARISASATLSSSSSGGLSWVVSVLAWPRRRRTASMDTPELKTARWRGRDAAGGSPGRPGRAAARRTPVPCALNDRLRPTEPSGQHLDHHGVPVVLGKFWSDIPDLRKHVTGYL
jgi:hypothetical protein